MASLKVPLKKNNPAWNKIGPACTPWLIFVAHVDPTLQNLSPVKDVRACVKSAPERERLRLPRLGAVTQVVVKTAALRRAAAHRGEKSTRGRVEPHDQDEEHFWPTFTQRAQHAFAQLFCNQLLAPLSFTGISSAWLLSTTTPLSHSDQTAYESPDKKDRQGLMRAGLAFFSFGCVYCVPQSDRLSGDVPPSPSPPPCLLSHTLPKRS